MCQTAHSCRGQKARPRVSLYCHDNGRPTVCLISIILPLSLFCLSSHTLSLSVYLSISLCLAFLYHLTLICLSFLLLCLLLSLHIALLSKSALMPPLSVSGRAAAHMRFCTHTHTHTHVLLWLRATHALEWLSCESAATAISHILAFIRVFLSRCSTCVLVKKALYM